MAHKLSLIEQLRGVEAAIRSPRTPKQLREGLRRRKKSLEKALRGSGGQIKKRKRHSLLDDLLAL